VSTKSVEPTQSNEDLLRNVYDVLERIEHAPVATVSADARPWNTPIYFARVDNSLYWTSRRDARHSRNIQQNGRAFIVVFDSSREDSSGAAVYFEADVVELTDHDDIRNALEQIYRRRNKSASPASQFSGSSPHAVYHARVVRTWTNVLHSGQIPWDERVEVNLR